MNAVVTVLYDWSRIVASCFTWAGPLAARIMVGVVFIGTGWTKLHHLPTITKNFTALGVPAPEILTPFISGVEFVGGLLLLIGLFTRLTTVPLMILMAVAVILARLEDITSLEEFLGIEEVAYFVIFAWLGIAGPGPVSVDHFVLKASGRDPAAHGA
jgi:putative oxidoreductase